MAGIAIIRPLPIAAIAAVSSGTGSTNLLTSSPREVWQTSVASSFTVVADFGSATMFDSVYLGGADIPAGSTWTISTSTAVDSGITAVGSGAFRLPGAIGPCYQSVLQLATPVTSRYLRITIVPSTSVAIQVGVLVAALAFSYPYAYGHGRPLIDTSRRVDLPDGGFGVEQGVTKSGFRWRFIDLVDAARDALWAIARDRGNSRPIVVIEDGSVSPPPDAAVHYGLFDKFEPWERVDARDTQWVLSMTEWR